MKDFDSYAVFHTHYGSPQINEILRLLNIERESTRTAKEDDWEGLDYDGVTTVSNVKRAKTNISSLCDAEDPEKLIKIEVFLDEILKLADTEKIYLSWG